MNTSIEMLQRFRESLNTENEAKKHLRKLFKIATLSFILVKYRDADYKTMRVAS